MVNVEVISNTKKAQEEILATYADHPDLGDRCQTGVIPEMNFLGAVGPKLEAALGFNPWMDSTDFPPGITILRELPNGDRSVVQVLHSFAMSDLRCTIANTGCMNLQPLPRERGPRVGRPPEFDRETGTITHHGDSLTNIDLLITNADDRASSENSRPECTVAPGNNQNQAIVEYIFGINMQVQQLEPPP